MLRAPLSACLLIALVTAAASAPRPKRAEAGPAPRQPAQEQDEFRSCDVAVREFVRGRKEAAALHVKEVKADSLRMTLNFLHPYGESGDTPPNLVFRRGESVEERRKALNEAKQRIRMLSEAAKTGNVWYVVAINKDTSDDLEVRRNPASTQSDEPRPTASASVFANMENRCVSVQEYRSIPLEQLSRDLRALLGDKERTPTHASDPVAVPPS